MTLENFQAEGKVQKLSEKLEEIEDDRKNYELVNYQ